MTEDQKSAVLSAVRSIAIALGSLAAAKGYIDADSVTGVVGALVTIISAAWGVVDKLGKEKS